MGGSLCHHLGSHMQLAAPHNTLCQIHDVGATPHTQPTRDPATSGSSSSSSSGAGVLPPCCGQQQLGCCDTAMHSADSQLRWCSSRRHSAGGPVCHATLRQGSRRLAVPQQQQQQQPAPVLTGHQSH
jgi:hypothetical protein